MNIFLKDSQSLKKKNLFEGIFGCLRPIWNFWPHHEVAKNQQIQSEREIITSIHQQINELNENSIDDDFQIPFEEFGSFKFIGSGAQGCVFKSTLRGEEVAVKKVKTKEEANVKHLRRLNHQNLVKFKGHLLDNEKVYCIVMEYCSLGNLYSFIEESRTNQNNFIKPDKMMNWAKQIASGMSYLHTNKIIHRDLKSPKYDD